MRALEISLREGARSFHVGTLVETKAGETVFAFSPRFVDLGPERPILSLLWHSVDGDDSTRRRMAYGPDKIGRRGFLPPWFSGLLPEGALRNMVERELGPGRHGEFTVLTRVGADLPGAVVASPAADDISLAADQNPDGLIRFSLAGVQMKFAADLDKDRITFPAHGRGGAYIAKTTSATVPQIVEAEHAAMTLARVLGIETVDFRLATIDEVDGVPEQFLRHGQFIFLSRRFDRPGGERLHAEDFAQIAEATGDMKYTAGTYETCVNIVKRFSTRPDDDVHQSLRRMVGDVLLGNGDAHLKNWCFTLGSEGPRLSPAYDIVPHAFWGDNRLALRLAGHYTTDTVSLGRITRIANFLKLAPGSASDLVSEMVERAFRLWPKVELPTATGAEVKEFLFRRLEELQLVRDVRPTLVPGHAKQTEAAEYDGGNSHREPPSGAE